MYIESILTIAFLATSSSEPFFSFGVSRIIQNKSTVHVSESIKITRYNSKGWYGETSESKKYDKNIRDFNRYFINASLAYYIIRGALELSYETHNYSWGLSYKAGFIF